MTSQRVSSPLPAARAAPAVDKAANALKPAIVVMEQCVLDDLFQPQRHDLLYKKASTAIGCGNMINTLSMDDLHMATRNPAFVVFESWHAGT